MNTHVKVTPTDLSRRSFLVGSAATGLVLGYAGVPGIDQALAAPSAFEPSVWFSIAPDGLVTVTCGKADMGQHIASTMAQIVAEELGASWKDMRVQLASTLQGVVTQHGRVALKTDQRPCPGTEEQVGAVR